MDRPLGKVIAVLFTSVRYTLSVLCLGRPQLDGFVIGDGDEEGRVGGGEGDAVDTLVVLQGGHLASPVPVSEVNFFNFCGGVKVEKVFGTDLSHTLAI